MIHYIVHKSLSVNGKEENEKHQSAPFCENRWAPNKVETKFSLITRWHILLEPPNVTAMALVIHEAANRQS